ncbi:unnamed protein product [Schistocephalus solidus]|uniref:Gelsolin-like domain-containing protein n=1 Tax=Schistocephalus solidus TaxID=70667 RepID=A0A3P7D0F4_SCHSO|nr:unnamed protein product [Schistocephalus solidus]
MVPVPEEDSGFFFNNEMYVILQATNKNAKMCFNVHYWIGMDRAKTSDTSPPPKVLELMSVLENQAVLHREIEGYESPQFKNYFKVFGVHNGTAGNIFNPKNPEAYKPRLLHFQLNPEKTRVTVFEVPISTKSLTNNDVFIYDEGTKMTQWNGSRCDEEERIAARKYIETALKSRKCKCTSEFLDEEDMRPQNEFSKKLGNDVVPALPAMGSKTDFQKTLYRLSDESRRLVMNKVYTGRIYRSGINNNDVTFIETFEVLYGYIGQGASENEKANTWDQAIRYLKDVNRPYKSIAVFAAGSYLQEFNEIWDDERQTNL